MTSWSPRVDRGRRPASKRMEAKSSRPRSERFASLRKVAVTSDLDFVNMVRSGLCVAPAPNHFSRLGTLFEFF